MTGWNLKVYASNPKIIFQTKPCDDGVVLISERFKSKRDAISFYKRTIENMSEDHFEGKQVSRFQPTSWDQEWRYIQLNKDTALASDCEYNYVEVDYEIFYG